VNAAAAFPARPRRAASPYARRLARERGLALDTLGGSGPGGRILAADVLAFRQPDPPPAHLAAGPPLVFSAAVSLAALARLAADAARAGFVIGLEDAALRASSAALSTLPGAGDAIVVEAPGRQILISAPPGLSIGAERRLRLAALSGEAIASENAAAASLLVLSTVRVVPVALPLLPGRLLRFVLAADAGREQAHALLCADPAALTPAQAADMLDAFARALEEPLALLA
jgi:pyruvate dehydrogenase E2 component (dihydrolipoamide acetyltransferase)